MAFFLGLLCSAAPARAQDLLTIEVGGGTHAPLSFGGDLGLDLPLGFFARGHVGWMPSFYVDTINAFATSAGWYDDATAELITGAIENSLILRASGGLRIPFVGLEAFVGYTAITLGGGTTGGSDRSLDGDSRGRGGRRSLRRPRMRTT